MKKIGLLACLMLAAWEVGAGSITEVTVGSDEACDYTSITGAIFNAPASDELIIRLAQNVSLTSGQLLTERNITITGGFEDCLAEERTGRTILDGSGFTGPLFFPATADNIDHFYVLELEHLEIRHHESTTAAGVLTLTGSWYSILNDVYAHQNSTTQDGGVVSLRSHADPLVLSPYLSIHGNSALNQNQASNGGALACDGLGQVFFYQSQLAGNTATQDGGGVYLTNGCILKQWGGGFLQGFFLNEAGDFGGGVAASHEAVYIIRSNYLGYGVAALVSNTATNGGGVSLSDGATLHAQDAIINDNSASSTGGGVRSNGGHVIIERVFPGASCHQEVRCSTVSNNTASGGDAGFSGGGGIATFGGSLKITGTYLENNSAQYGSAIRARFMPNVSGPDSDLMLAGNVVTGNSGAPQVIYLDESSADIAFSTFADNADLDRVIEMAYPTSAGVGHQVVIAGSIFDELDESTAGAEVTTGGPMVLADCNRYDPASLGALVSGSRSTLILPQFVNRSLGDYRLEQEAALVDWCDGSFVGGFANHTANGYERPVDQYGVANIHGTYDLGGLERYAEDVIFASGLD